MEHVKHTFTTLPMPRLTCCAVDSQKAGKSRRSNSSVCWSALWECIPRVPCLCLLAWSSSSRGWDALPQTFSANSLLPLEFATPSFFCCHLLLPFQLQDRSNIDTLCCVCFPEQVKHVRKLSMLACGQSFNAIVSRCTCVICVCSAHEHLRKIQLFGKHSSGRRTEPVTGLAFLLVPLHPLARFLRAFFARVVRLNARHSVPPDSQGLHLRFHFLRIPCRVNSPFEFLRTAIIKGSLSQGLQHVLWPGRRIWGLNGAPITPKMRGVQ